jgi:hypothetical protein
MSGNKVFPLNGTRMGPFLNHALHEGKSSQNSVLFHNVELVNHIGIPRVQVESSFVTFRTDDIHARLLCRYKQLFSCRSPSM